MVPFIGCSTIHSLGRLRRIKYPASQVEVGIQTSQQSPIVFILFFHKILPLSLSQFFFRISVNLENRGSITIWLTSCLTGLDSTKLVNLYLIQYKQSSRILTSQAGGQPYSNTSPYKVSECSLYQP